MLGLEIRGDELQHPEAIMPLESENLGPVTSLGLESAGL
jgi:hypothetical protein